jgi:glycosyltransferase involved in cell wall biosynthesis
MRVAIFPAHDDNAASSRIRAFTLLKTLSLLGHDARLRDAAGADVVVIQKRVTPRTIAVVDHAKREGALIVYDVDDVGRDLWYFTAPSTLHRLLHRVDIVTTDTAAHAALLERDYSVERVEIVPDTIDYYPAGPVRVAVDTDRTLRILWFGNAANITLFEKYSRALANVPRVELVVATNRSAIPRLSQRFPHVSFVPWSRDDFVALLQSCALTVLPHDGSESDRAKSNNRMIASIAWGVPAVVSRTPEYVRTAIEAGVADALFGDERELVSAIERLRDAGARRAYLDAAQSEVWLRYSPAAVAERFVAVVKGARRHVPALPPYSRWLRRATHGHIASALVHEVRHVAARWLRRIETSP